MPVTCPECSSDSVDLVERLGDYERRLQCEACGHQWLRHAQAVSPKDQAAQDAGLRNAQCYGCQIEATRGLRMDRHTVDTRYWTHLPDGRVQCDVCPRQCRLQEGQRGFCFVRMREGDRIVLTTYGRSSGYC